jgi:hypothetical protein
MLFTSERVQATVDRVLAASILFERGDAIEDLGALLRECGVEEMLTPEEADEVALEPERLAEQSETPFGNPGNTGAEPGYDADGDGGEGGDLEDLLRGEGEAGDLEDLIPPVRRQYVVHDEDHEPRQAREHAPPSPICDTPHPYEGLDDDEDEDEFPYDAGGFAYGDYPP